MMWCVEVLVWCVWCDEVCRLFWWWCEVVYVGWEECVWVCEVCLCMKWLVFDVWCVLWWVFCVKVLKCEEMLICEMMFYCEWCDDVVVKFALWKWYFVVVCVNVSGDCNDLELEVWWVFMCGVCVLNLEVVRVL